MRRFLSEKRHAELISNLTNLGMPEGLALRYASYDDDFMRLD